MVITTSVLRRSGVVPDNYSPEGMERIDCLVNKSGY